MKKVVRLDSWEEFETNVSAIFENLKSRRAKTGGYISSLLFRGHAQECWKLKTTLERYSPTKEYSTSDYHKLMLRVRPTVESLTSKPWDLPTLTDIMGIDEDIPNPPPGYEFMVYLRHHGFPSPLLDWSRSPYIAAFFAFHSYQDNAEGNIAIYSYIETDSSGKSSSPNEGSVTGVGSYITTHKRHYIQQCEYTICKKKIGIGNGHIYFNHEESFQQSECNQDILTKFLIPTSERGKVLARLDLMNINAYSLFGNEDNLMKTLAYREIEARAK
jgi:hypothetical protein